MTEYLELADLLNIADMAIRGDVLVRDYSLLESALARPRASVFGQDAFPSTIIKAAALFHSLCTNHALVDGNKRLAASATAVFLDLNEAEMTMSGDELVALALAVADGSLADVEKIATRLY